MTSNNCRLSALYCVRVIIFPEEKNLKSEPGRPAIQSLCDVTTQVLVLLSEASLFQTCGNFTRKRNLLSSTDLGIFSSHIRSCELAGAEDETH